MNSPSSIVSTMFIVEYDKLVNSEKATLFLKLFILTKGSTILLRLHEVRGSCEKILQDVLSIDNRKEEDKVETKIKSERLSRDNLFAFM